MAIRQLSRGKWQLIVDYYDASGNRHKKTKVVESTKKKEVEQMYEEFKRSLSAPKEDTCTVEELLLTYVESREIAGVSRNTIRGYEVCSKRLNSAFGRVLAKDLTPFQLEQFVASMVKIKGYSGKTIKNTISLLNAAYSRAIKQRLLSENPCEYITMPKQEEKDIVVLKENEIAPFLAGLQNEEKDFQVLCKLALFCGLRLSEILGILESDVNENFNTISINKSRHTYGYESWFQDTKTKKSRRIVGVPDFLMQDIVELINSREVSNTDCLIQYNGEPMRASQAESRMARFKKRFGYEVTIHGLRHTFASMLNASGDFDIAEISAAMGHSNITTTLNIYTHTFESQSRSSRRIAENMQKWCMDGANDEPTIAQPLAITGF